MSDGFVTFMLGLVLGCAVAWLVATWDDAEKESARDAMCFDIYTTMVASADEGCLCQGGDGLVAIERKGGGQ
ncbi:MAG: hypothetical protein FJ090_19875 [Deltaproteobacteria bacterium]|nr:hypothetical protein [Deltaproteobacteria bacterium]